MKALTSLSRRAAAVALFVALLAAAASAQEGLGEAASKQLQAQAEECGNAFVKGNYGRLVECTVPKLVELVGGREKMIDLMRREVEEGKAEGFYPLSSAQSAPTQVLRVGGQTYAVVPYKLRMRAPEEILVSDSFMVGVSDDGGQTWKFLSADSTDEAKLKVLLPDAAGKLKVPPAKYSSEPLPAKP